MLADRFASNLVMYGHSKWIQGTHEGMHYDLDTIYDLIDLHRTLQTFTRMMQSYFANAPFTFSLTADGTRCIKMNTK